MGKFSCNCLNVKIHTKGDADNVKPCDVTQLGIIPIPPVDEFFSQLLAEVHLNIEGITKEFNLLTRTYTIAEDWNVHRCINCKLWTHASQANSNTVLVNTSLKNTQTEIEQLKQSSEYSILYKILVPARNEHFITDMVAVDSSEVAEVEDNLSNLEYNCDRFLKDEECNMNAQIRDFEEQKRERFASVEGKVRRDKNAIRALILATQQAISEEINSRQNAASAASKLISMSPSPAKPIGPTAPSSLTRATPSPGFSGSARVAAGTTKPGFSGTTKAARTGFAPFAGTTGVRSPITKVTTTNLAAQVVAPSPPAPAPVKPRSALSSMLEGRGSGAKRAVGETEAVSKQPLSSIGDDELDMDPMFPNEDTGDQRPFYVSDDDDELGDTDDSEPDIRGSSSSGGGQVGGSRALYSSSVPIGINMNPSWGGGAAGGGGTQKASVAASHHFKSFDEEEEDYEAPSRPDDMAASIKAMARSVHNDGTEVFGELPTSIFKNVKPF